MSILYFGNNQNEITSLYNDSASCVAVRFGNSPAKLIASEDIAHHLSDTVIRLTEIHNVNRNKRDIVPTNVKAGLIGFQKDVKSHTKENARIIFGAGVTLDYLHMAGKKKADPDKVATQMIEKLEGQIPEPSFAVLADTITLIYEFQRPWVLPEKKKEKKKLLAKLEMAMQQIANQINGIDMSCNAVVTSLTNGIYLPETARKKFERKKDGTYTTIANVMVTILPMSEMKYSLYDILKAASNCCAICDERSAERAVEMVKMEEILHRNCKGGNVLVAFFNNSQFGVGAPTYLSMTPSVIKMIATSRYDAYMYLQMQRGNGTDATAAFNFPGIFIDLDLNDKKSIDPEVRMDRINDAIKTLDEAFSDGIIPQPTLLCNTGGGLALYYILRSPIPNLQANGTKKAKAFLHDIWDYLMDTIDEIIENQPIEVDRTCKADWHLIRLAGTYNTEAEVFCKMIEATGEPVYYELRDLAGAGMEKWKDQRHQQEGEKRTFATHQKRDIRVTYVGEREAAWANVIKDKLENQEDIDGKTEMLLHLYANMLAYNYPMEEVKKSVEEVNSKLEVPLPSNRVKDAYSSVDTYMKRNGTPYPYSDQRLFSIVGNTSALKEYVTIEKVKHVQESHNQWEEWKAFAEEHKKGSEQYLTLNQISNHFGISVSTLKNAFKRLSYNRESNTIRAEWKAWVQFAKEHERGSDHYLSLSQIAEHFSVGERTLKSAFAKMQYVRNAHNNAERKRCKKSTTDAYRILCTSIRTCHGSLHYAPVSIHEPLAQHPVYAGSGYRLHFNNSTASASGVPKRNCKDILRMYYAHVHSHRVSA